MAQITLNSTGVASSGALVLQSNGTTTAVTVDTSQNVALSTGNLVISTSGKGIDFSATAGTGTSELLADYEEGTWTPIFASTGFTPTFTQQTGRYTKIGRLVTAQFYIQVSAVSGTLTNALTITGLPFTSNATEVGSSGCFGVYQFATLKTIFMAGSSTSINIYDAGTVTQTTGAALLAGFYLGTISYIV